jgi:hypothetical protein
MGALFFEVSAMTGPGIENLFRTVASEALAHPADIGAPVPPGPVPTENTKKEGGGCMQTWTSGHEPLSYWQRLR